MSKERLSGIAPDLLEDMQKELPERTAPHCAGLEGCHELEGVMYDLFVHDPKCPKGRAAPESIRARLVKLAADLLKARSFDNADLLWDERLRLWAIEARAIYDDLRTDRAALDEAIAIVKGQPIAYEVEDIDGSTFSKSYDAFDFKQKVIAALQAARPEKRSD